MKLSTNGLCECGCLNLAPIAKRTSNQKGHVKGTPMRFINGHNNKVGKGPNDIVHLSGNRIGLILTQGEIAIIDATSYELVRESRWFLRSDHGRKYAYRHIRREDGRNTSEPLHRVVTNARKGLDIDHRDHNGLNDVLSNLREATRSQNLFNTGKRSSSTGSMYKGVSPTPAGKWSAHITVNGVAQQLGNFEKEIDAALAYDEVARLHRKEFATLNVPEATDEVRESRVKHVPHIATSKFEGVALSYGGKWRSYIYVNGKTMHLGSFLHEVDAATTYDFAAFVLHGDKAKLNFPFPITEEYFLAKSFRRAM